MSKGKKESFQDVHPILQELREYLRNEEISQKKAATDLYNFYIDSEKTEGTYYQRFIKLMNNEIHEVTEQEIAGIKRWLHAERNKHSYGSAFHKIPNLPKTIDQLAKYLDSSYVNRTEAKRLIKRLRTLNSLSDAHISAETAQDTE